MWYLNQIELIGKLVQFGTIFISWWQEKQHLGWRLECFSCPPLDEYLDKYTSKVKKYHLVSITICTFQCIYLKYHHCVIFAEVFQTECLKKQFHTLGEIKSLGFRSQKLCICLAPNFSSKDVSVMDPSVVLYYHWLFGQLGIKLPCFTIVLGIMF